MTTLTPKNIVAELDKYIVGQAAAKRAVAIAVRNRWRRRQLPIELRKDVLPKNILLVGSTGVGKTEIARRLATLTKAPFIKVEATKFTEVGYHGRDVDSMIRDLLDVAIQLVRDEKIRTVEHSATAAVEERVVDSLSTPDNRQEIREKFRAGSLEDEMIDISIEDKPTASSLLGPAAFEMDVEMQSMFERMIPARRDTRRLSVREARRLLLQQEADKLIDKGNVITDAVNRTEEDGIVFIDEIDKVTSSGKDDGPDVSRQGVQRDLLPIVEGSTVTTKHGPVRTDHILFVAAGAFHTSSPGDLMPELQGRFPIRAELMDLTRDDFVRILAEPRNSLTSQQVALLKTEGVELKFTAEGIDAIAAAAFEQNRKVQNIGARRLHTIMERVFEDVSFEAPDVAAKTIVVDTKYVRERLK